MIRAAARDRRWVRIRRPVVTVGGELTLEMLDLSFNAIAKFYEAPLQMKANGGVFVVDDFGRQRVRPRDLLNRWIVPLESRVDYLTLHTGKKFEVPFDVLIVFATNLNPESLADEAFLRRIPYKIYATNPTTEEFTKIFALNCKRQNVSFDPVIVEYLQRRYYEPRGLDCAPAIRATWSRRSSTCAATRTSRRTSRASCWTTPAATTSSRSRRASRPPERAAATAPGRGPTSVPRAGDRILRSPTHAPQARSEEWLS